MIDRPVITPDIMPYYEGWKLIHPRRQYNEAGAQPSPLSEVIAAARFVFGDDEDDIKDFCEVYTIAESAVLNDLAEKRKQAIKRAQNKK